MWVFFPKPLLVETVTVHRGPFTQYVIEEGKTRARDVFQILSPVSGNLKRVEHKAGDLVKTGDLLAEVEWPSPWKIKSPVDGRILRIQRESGGPIERGQIIMEVADPHSLEIVSEILTDDALQIHPGAPVRIESWGGCPPLQGKVRLVEPAAFTKVSALGIEEQRVNVIIDFTSPLKTCPGMADGYRVNDYITVYQTKDALSIPSGALFRSGDSWAVFRVVNGRARKTLVEVPRHNPQNAMVTAGLKEGDEVVVYPSDRISEGTRLRRMK